MRHAGRHSPALRRSGVAIAVACVIVFTTATAASATFPVLSGSARCDDGEHVVDWTIANSERTGDKAMTVVEAVARHATGDYAVTGFGSSIPPGGSTAARTRLPGDLTGTVRLSVTGSWNAGRTVTTRTVDVDLAGPCEPAATTTSVPTPTTTAIESPTTTSGAVTVGEASASTTTVAGNAPTTTAGPQETSSGTPTPTLPRTGASDALPLIGSIAVTLGALTLLVARRTR